MTTSKNALLSKIEQELTGIRVIEPVTIGKHRYGLATLDTGEESLARGLIPENTPLWQAVADNSLQVLSVALRSIDDTPVETLFSLADDMPADARAAALADEKRWRARQIMDWLKERPGTFVRSLWTEYLGMLERSNKALEELKNF